MDQGLRVGSGVGQLDHLLGGLYIGDNVVWHDDAGSLAAPFCLSFVRASQEQGRPIIYVSFDRSPTNLLDKLGPLAKSPLLTILDCFTHGKGQGNEVFRRFYSRPPNGLACQVTPVAEPRSMQAVMDAFYGVHGTMTGDVRFVFESLTGMQELWGGEEAIINFYSHSCPRLYELKTIAYWIMEKQAHSSRLRAQIAQIAQVVIDLAVKRGTTSLTIIKAEKRDLDSLHQPHNYWTKDLEVTFNDQHRAGGVLDLGYRLKDLRARKGLSQTELARLVGVTPSTISQVESNLIFPSLPALVKMAEVLSVEISSFFSERGQEENPVVFPAALAEPAQLADLPEEAVTALRLIPETFKTKAQPYIIEVPPKRSLPAHFFVHKGEELGYVLAGRLQLKVNKAVYTARAGEVIYLTSEMPTQWSNPGRAPARLLWVKIG
ncbi:MAG: helix-turn-helix domain-containing protein [Desulfarculus sp.]|nr:helix-turn-helix domain-containing protein [Desulfarculus sp.]